MLVRVAEVRRRHVYAPRHIEAQCTQREGNLYAKGGPRSLDVTNEH